MPCSLCCKCCLRKFFRRLRFAKKSVGRWVASKLRTIHAILIGVCTLTWLGIFNPFLSSKNTLICWLCTKWTRFIGIWRTTKVGELRLKNTQNWPKLAQNASKRSLVLLLTFPKNLTERLTVAFTRKNKSRKLWLTPRKDSLILSPKLKCPDTLWRLFRLIPNSPASRPAPTKQRRNGAFLKTFSALRNTLLAFCKTFWAKLLIYFRQNTFTLAVMNVQKQLGKKARFVKIWLKKKIWKMSMVCKVISFNALKNLWIPKDAASSVGTKFWKADLRPTQRWWVGGVLRGAFWRQNKTTMSWWHPVHIAILTNIKPIPKTSRWQSVASQPSKKFMPTNRRPMFWRPNKRSTFWARKAMFGRNTWKRPTKLSTWLTRALVRWRKFCGRQRASKILRTSQIAWICTSAAWINWK